MQESNFSLLWDKLVVPTYIRYETSYGDLYLPEESKNNVEQYYNELLDYTKKHYMNDPNGILNRHKVAAALLIAILKEKPIKKTGKQHYLPNLKGSVEKRAFNESLALSVSLSVLRRFIIERAEAIKEKRSDYERFISEGSCIQDLDIFDKGIPITKEDKKEWEWELYQIRQDGAYNVLALAHLFKLIEEKKRIEFFLDNPKEYNQYKLLHSSQKHSV